MSRPPGRDDVLARRAAEGDRAAFAELLDRHGDQAWTFAVRALGGDQEEAARALETAWATVWRTLPERDERVPVGLWVLAAAVRACRETHVGRSEVPPGPAPAHDAVETDGGEPWQALARALVRLPWSPRAAWLLHELHDLDPRETALVLGTEETAVVGLLATARVDLRRLLGTG